MSDDSRADYFERLDALNAKLETSYRMLEAARTLGAPLSTIQLWERIVAQDRRDIIIHRDNRTTQTRLT